MEFRSHLEEFIYRHYFHDDEADEILPLQMLLPRFAYEPAGLFCGDLPYDGRMLRTVAEEEPDLALVAECMDAVGNTHSSPELQLWRLFIDGELADDADARPILAQMPALAERWRGDVKRLRWLYFTVVLPIAAAVDYGSPGIAKSIFYRRFLTHTSNPSG